MKSPRVKLCGSYRIVALDILGTTDVMFNDFVLVGPRHDPAGIRGLTDAKEALRRIAGRGATFASRGDDSGTNRMELRLWKAIGTDPRKLGPGYRELGAGMGPTLNTAAAMNSHSAGLDSGGVSTRIV